MSTQLVSVFSERLYGDKSFASALEHDPLRRSATRASPILRRLRSEIAIAGELVEQLYADDEFRGESSRTRSRSSSAGVFRSSRSDRCSQLPVLRTT